MMRMYAHRRNAQWVEGLGGLTAPHVFHTARFATEAKGAQAGAFREQAAEALREGQVAVQVGVARRPLM